MVNSFTDALAGIGRYVLLMGRVLTQPDRWRMFFRQYVTEMFQLGYNSIGIVLIISFFIGADQTQHPESLDAANGGRIHHS